MERAQVVDYFIGTDQKIPDWLNKVLSLGEVQVAIRSGIKSRFSIMGFSISLELVVFSLNSPNSE